jgi:hypothetical protein
MPLQVQNDPRYTDVTGLSEIRQVGLAQETTKYHWDFTSPLQLCLAATTPSSSSPMMVLPSWLQRVKLGAQHAIVQVLPQGYPTSVSTNYLRYTLWTSASMVCSAICGVLSMEALLAGVGVGNGAVTPVAAALR